MAAKAVSRVSISGAATAAPTESNTLTLPKGRRPAPRQPAAEVVLFEEASAVLPKPHVTTEQEAAAALQHRQHSQDRERRSRERALKILRQWRAGDTGTDGQAMLARPLKDIPIAVLTPEVLEAALARQFADAHLIDRMWDQCQLSDWQYATANRLLQLCERAGLLASKVAQVGRIGTGHAEMSDGMAEARAQLNRLMRRIGHPGNDLLISLCLGQFSYASHKTTPGTLKSYLGMLADHWGIDRR